MFGWFKRRQRRRILAAPFPEKSLECLRQNVWQFDRLSDSEKKKLIECVKLVVAETSFEGCDGLQVDDSMKVVIAGHASLLLLGTKDYYFDTVSAVLIFPGNVERRTQHGMIANIPQVNAGEAYSTGQIVLSWERVLDDGRYKQQSNVVIHEFAHHVDGLDGEMAGSISFDDPNDSQAWEQVSRREYEALKIAHQNHQRTFLDQYGAKNEAEFFAVISEAFFQQPVDMAIFHSELFDLLQKFYKTDSRLWEKGQSGY